MPDMVLGRGDGDENARKYLRLRMRPLSPGALSPVRRQVGDHTVTAVALGCLTAALLVLAPFIYFLSIFGDPYPLAFVERRPDGYYAQLRACESDSVRRVEVYPYDGHTESPDPIWVAAAQSGSAGAKSVRLFEVQSGFDTTAVGAATPTLYEVSINEGYASESWVVVEQRRLGVGEVAGGGDPMSRADYDSMSDSDFGCPSR